MQYWPLRIESGMAAWPWQDIFAMGPALINCWINKFSKSNMQKKTGYEDRNI